MPQPIERVIEQCGRIILGKERQIRLAVACLLARGHLLIEDVPGVGKTTMAHALARSLGLDFHRVQFTSDLLPADILGVSIFDRESGRFIFHPGPIFAQLILADEVNRATPKTQSALLEAMEEQQVTIEGETRPLPSPFFVIATQNPSHLIGTFPLPESQLDRFLMRIRLGYPDRQAERGLLAGIERREIILTLSPVMDWRELGELQHKAKQVHVSSALLDYLQAIIAFTRASPHYQNGMSPRAGLALLSGARAWALLEGRSHVLPEDVQAVLGSVVGHRLRSAAEYGEAVQLDLAGRIIEEVAIP
jgi:MoxR-like ATPase